MFCPKCGAQISDGAAFCSHCGSATADGAQAQSKGPEVEREEPVTASAQPSHEESTRRYGAGTQVEFANKGRALLILRFAVVGFAFFLFAGWPIEYMDPEDKYFWGLFIIVFYWVQIRLAIAACRSYETRLSVGAQGVQGLGIVRKKQTAPKTFFGFPVGEKQSFSLSSTKDLRVEMITPKLLWLFTQDGCYAVYLKHGAQEAAQRLQQTDI